MRLHSTTLALLICASATSASAQSWTNLAPAGTAPIARYRHTTVYDPSSNRLILFGGHAPTSGCGLNPQNDTWVLTNANGLGGPSAWMPLAPTGPLPAARGAHGAGYDAANDRMIVFGGDSAGCVPPTFSDVWVLNGASGTHGTPAWTQLAASGSTPPGLVKSAVAYDPVRNILFVFSGNTSEGNCGGERNDVWRLSNANGLGGPAVWTQFAPPGARPAARWYSSSVYDTTSDRLTIFGGVGTCGGAFNDTWVVTNASTAPAWVQLTPAGPAPSPGGQHSAVYDAADNTMTIFGGTDNVGTPLNTVWKLQGANGLVSPSWLHVFPTGSLPLGRYSHSAGYDAATKRLTIFGGFGTVVINGVPQGALFNDAWVLSPSAQATSLSVTASGTYGGTATLRATLTANGAPLSLRTIAFKLNGSPVGSAATGADGVAQASGVSLAGVSAGTYVGAVSANVAGDAAYLASAGTGDLVVGKASPVVTWNPAPPTYGTPLGDGQFNATAAFNGSPVDGVFVYTPGPGTILPAGLQSLSVTFTPTDTTNLTQVTTSRMVTVAKANLTVTAADKFKEYAAPLPAFTATYTGFVNGDTPAVLGGTLAFSTPAAASSPLGTYDITPSGLTSSNYAITFAKGTLTVRDTTPPVLTLPANISREALGPSGIAVSYTASAFDAVDGARAVACAPASGSTFAIGTTTVNCSATDAHNNSALGTFMVTVTDSTPPAFSLPTTVTAQVIATVPVGSNPYPVGVNLATNRVYVGNFSSNTVSVLDGATNGVMAVIGVGVNPHGIAVNALTNRIYVANYGSHTVSVINGASNLVVATIGVPNSPRGLAVDGASNRVFVTTRDADSLQIIDGNTNQVVGAGATGSYPFGVDVNGGIARVYVANLGGSTVNVLDSAGGAGGSVQVGSSPSGVSIDPSTKRIFVTNSGSNTVSVIDPVMQSVIATVPAGTSPGGIAANDSMRHVYVANYVGNTVSVLEGASYAALASVPVNTAPSGLAVNAATGRVYVTNYGSNTLSVIQDSIAITAEATSPAGAVVNYAVTASDVVDGSVSPACTPASGSTFPAGNTTVTCSATDHAGNTSSASFAVTIHDTTPPVVTVPANITNEATNASGAALSFTASAADLVDGARPVTCSPASGATFALGPTTVHCSSSDTHGNTGDASFTVTVQDTTPPAVTVPGPITTEATGANGAAVSFAASATDLVDGARPVTCTPATGATFALGPTTVNCSSSDTHGNAGTASFTVTVHDTTPPAVTVPANITVDATGPSGAVVTYTASATDIVSGTVRTVPVLCSPASGSTFPIGTTVVNCTATDAAGYTAIGSFQVLVLAAAAQVNNLVGMVQTFNPAQGVKSSLDAKLQNISSALNAAQTGTVRSVCGQLGAFINEVAAQSNKKLTVAQGNQLTTAALRIEAVIGCR